MKCSTDCIRHFRRSIRVIEREAARMMKDGGSCCGVTLSQCHVLMELDSRGGLTLSDLASLTGIDKSNLSRTVDSLVQEGSVERIISKEDRREIRISLTEKGKKSSEEINSTCDAYYSELFSRIPEVEWPQVVKALGYVAEGITAMKKEGLDQDCCTTGGKK